MADIRFHTVTEGDTLGAIASHYGVDTDKLAQENDLKNKNKIKVGQVIQIPYPTSTPKEDKYVKPEPTKAPIQPEGTSFPAYARGGPMPEPPKDQGLFPNRPPGIYPDEVAKRVFDQVVGMAKAAKDVFTAPGRAYSGDLQVMGPDGHATPEAIRAGVNTALMTSMGGAAGTGERALAAALPEGELRNLPTMQKATGRVGLMQQAQRTGALHDAGIDPMWVDTVMRGHAPTGNVAPQGEFTLGSGPVKDNVVNMGDYKPKLTDPKTNLQRRMAQRGQGNQVIPQGRFVEKLGQNVTPEEVAAAREGAAAQRAQGAKSPKKALEPVKLHEAKDVKSFQQRIEELGKQLQDMINPEFP